MSVNYSQYLTTKRCCNLNTGGPQGPQGFQGPGSVGPIGYQGVTGTQGAQGSPGTQANVVFLTSNGAMPTSPSVNQTQKYINTTASHLSITIEFLNPVIYGSQYTSYISLPAGKGIELIWNTTDSNWYVMSETSATFYN